MNSNVELLIDELENQEPTPPTQQEIEFMQIKNEIETIKKMLSEIIRTECEIVSKIGNIITKINLMDDRIILH